MRAFTIFFFLCLTWCTALAENAYFYEAKAQQGDGILSLLRRYKLLEHTCNVEQFYTLNRLSKNAVIQADRKYKIPILIYAYNGQSIRSTIGIDDWEKAVRIKAYNSYLKKNGLRKMNYVKSRILWVPYHEIHCADHTTTENSKPELKANEVYLPLFGKNYSRVEVLDNSLSTAVFYIVSGHGGPDPGAQCTTCPKTLCEDEYAYDVSLRLARNLRQHGATVHMIIQDANDGIRDEEHLPCDRDETCLNAGKIPLNQKKRLRQRTQVINTLYKHYRSKGITQQRAIMIHVDSNSERKRQDVYFYHLRQSRTGKRVAESIRNTFQRKYDQHQKGRGYRGLVYDHRNLFMLRNTHPAAVYVELANIRNRHDHKRLLLHTNRQALANWLFEGLVESLD